MSTVIHRSAAADCADDEGKKKPHLLDQQPDVVASTACNASPSAPFSGFRPSRPSVFMCPMVGSIALRR